MKDETRSILPETYTGHHTYGTYSQKTVKKNSDDSSLKLHNYFSLENYITPHIQIIGLLILWYALNVMYNLDNKHTLNMLPLPWFVSTFQLLFGWVFFITAWSTGFRPMPKLLDKYLFFKCIVPQGVCHLLVHIGAVVSMRCGAVSFTHIVKAAEPVLTAVLSGLFLKQVFSWQTYMSLVPVVVGVMMASVTELSFTWASFIYSMISNLGSSGRAIIAKKVMASDQKEKLGEHLSSANMYALLTIVATCISIPLALIIEGPICVQVWEQARVEYSAYDILYKACGSAFWYYTYNEIAYLCLEKVNQVTHAVANTLKRVVIIVASIIVFQTPVSQMGAAGSCVAIMGTLLYSLSKTKYG